MSHVRKQVRDAVVARVTGLPTSGSRVFNGRVWAFEQASELPALRVDVTDDSGTMDRTIHGSAWIRRSVSVEIEAKAKGTGNLVDLLDTMGEEVEAALGASLVVSGIAVDLDYLGMSLSLSADGDQPVGSLTMRFSALCWHPAGDQTLA